MNPWLLAIHSKGHPQISGVLAFFIAHRGLHVSALDPQTRSSSAAVTEELHLACELIGRHEKSAEVWAAFHAQNPEDGEALFMVAQSWLRAGRPEEAASWYRLASEVGISDERIERMKRKARDMVENDRSGQ